MNNEFDKKYIFCGKEILIFQITSFKLQWNLYTMNSIIANNI